MHRLLVGAAATLACCMVAAGAATGVVVDAQSHLPVAGAIITAAPQVVRSDQAGHFKIDTASTSLALRAPGYQRLTVKLDPAQKGDIRVELKPFQAKALYLSSYGIASKLLRDEAFALIDKTEINALVIDVKGDRGLITYRSSVPLASEIGAQKIVLIKDMPEVIANLHSKGIYLIGRIVTFKDDLLANARPKLAVRDAKGGIWHDREGLAWVDALQKEVWQYDLDIAEEAAKLGFDEIQFDYIRFPDARGLQFSGPSTEETRVEAITGFLMEARKRLAPYNTFVAADIFGYVCWNLNDTDIGQKIDRLGDVLDYISPMLYPSGYRFGIPGYLDPVKAPYEIVHRSLERAKQRSGLDGRRFRPWLQVFKDYAFDRRHFGGDEIDAQINAANAASTNGWMLWNPRNRYPEVKVSKAIKSR